MIRANRSGLGYEDPLTYLPRRPAQEFLKGRTIYDAQRPSEGLYVVILGRVKIVSVSEDGCQTIGRIVCTEGLFGESALLGPQKLSISAVAIDTVTLMAWTREEIEQQIEQEPRLGIALSQCLVRQCLALQDRIESMAIHKTPERVMLAMVRLAAELGTPQPDGSVQIGALAHHTIADYVGTSREIVTFQMNRLRRMGLLRYSRKHIDINSLAIQDVLREQGVNVPQMAALAQRAMA